MAFRGLGALGALVFTVGIAVTGSVSAAPIVDKVDKSKEIKAGKSYLYNHNLEDEGYSVDGSYAITTASLVIKLADEHGSESYRFSIGNGLEVHSYSDDIGDEKTFTFQLTGATLATLVTTGKLRVEIFAESCDHCGDYAFEFLKSTLRAEVAPKVVVPQQAAAVPEPGTLSLLGLGLAGLAALGRRRTRKPSKSTYGDRRGSDPNSLSTSIAHSPMEAP